MSQQSNRQSLKAVSNLLDKKKKKPEKNQFSFLYEPSQTSVAVSTETNSLTKDVAQVRLDNNYVWPEGFPEEKKKKDNAVRVHFQVTNAIQCKRDLESVLRIKTVDPT